MKLIDDDSQDGRYVKAYIDGALLFFDGKVADDWQRGYVAALKAARQTLFEERATAPVVTQGE